MTKMSLWHAASVCLGRLMAGGLSDIRRIASEEWYAPAYSLELPSEGWREKEGMMPSKTEVMVWGFVVIAMCIVVMGMMNPWS